MIDLVLKPHGTYQYRWERDESGWEEVRAALGDYATYSPGEDEASLSFWGDSREVTITIYAKTDYLGHIAIPRAMIEAAMTIRVWEKGADNWLAYDGMSIIPGKDRYEETFAKIVLTYK